MEKELREAERRLQAAQFAGDVQALDELLDDRLLFTLGADTFTKADDLELHRTGAQVVSRLEEEELTVLVHGTTGVTWFLGVVEGSVHGSPFAARMRYTRAWAHDSRGWRVVAAHASVAEQLSP
ncbi:MAG: nuclear transport factor 2 family protein [Mycobacteriaceae bacterium]|nr:nuclear transport factor 2 family protein [Mycobacteriaceae bacterium]